MATHQARLKIRREIAEGTMAFHFQKPPGFTFKTGQALSWTLLDPPETDAEVNTRNFSIASAAGEADFMKEGIIRAAEVNADYTIRSEPSDTVSRLRTLRI